MTYTNNPHDSQEGRPLSEIESFARDRSYYAIPEAVGEGMAIAKYSNPHLAVATEGIVVTEEADISDLRVDPTNVTELDQARRARDARQKIIEAAPQRAEPPHFPEYPQAGGF